MVYTPKNIDVFCSYIQILLVLDEVTIIGDMFGSLPSINFDDHDLANIEAFVELAPELYLERVLYDIVLKVVPMLCAHELAGSGLLNLL